MVQVIILICFGFLMTGVYRELEFAGVVLKETSYRNPNHLMPMIVLEICRAIFNLVSGGIQFQPKDVESLFFNLMIVVHIGLAYMLITYRAFIQTEDIDPDGSESDNSESSKSDQRCPSSDDSSV